jgi:hypothetical protein
MKRERVGDYVLGLTRAESRVAISIEGAIVASPDTAEECLLPQLGVSLSYAPIVIYVGSEFVPGSCAYREILAHEMRHLNAYVGYLPKVENAGSTIRRPARVCGARPVAGARAGRTRRTLDALHQARNGEGDGAASGHRQFRRIRAPQQSLPG